MSEAAENSGPGSGPGTDTSTGPAPEPGTADEAGQLAGQAARIAELEDLRLRALADLDNVRKRCAAQIRQAEAQTRGADARQQPPPRVAGAGRLQAWPVEVLARLGSPRRDDRGARFDPARHEAVATRPDPRAEADVVAEVVRPAYGEGDHQLRPAQVVVARPG